MKPLNFDDKGCNYTSSNCVIWQGPDIPCIKLCKGDSVSDVVYKLATELCDVLTVLDIEQYDLSCLQLVGCAPKDFHEFIQILIQIICELQACCAAGTGSGSRSATAISDTVLSVAPCFYYTNELGDTITTMTVTDYVRAIGTRVCTQGDRLASVEAAVAVHTEQINAINLILANPLPVVIPLVTPTCVLPPFPTEMNVVLTVLEQQFCELVGATGSPSNIYNSIARQCAGLNQLPVLSGGTGNMSSLDGWAVTVNSMANAVNNIWLTVCDLRSAVQNIKLNCCPQGCEGILMDLQATTNGTNVFIFLTGTIPSGFTTCSPLGTLVTITDDNGGSMTAYMDIVTFINNPTGFNIAIAGTPINPLSNLHVHMEPCLTNSETGATCQSCLNYTIVNQANCPVILYTPDADSISYSGTSLAGTAQYTVEIWNNLGTVLIGTQVQVQTAPTPFSGTFTGLIPNTTYKLRVKVTVNGVETVCPFEAVPLVETALAPIALGAANEFAVLAGAGITNVGTSTICGSVGSDPTNTVVGITAPDVICGTLYTASDAAVIAAKAALSNAIADGLARVPYVTLGADNLGGSTISSGYFDTPGGTIALTGNVTFDAGGDPNAVFIIQSTTTLITDPSSTVTLINGAQFKYIYWIVGTDATLGNDSFFKGNLLTNGDIAVQDSVNVEGRIFADSGTVDLDDDTISNI